MAAATEVHTFTSIKVELGGGWVQAEILETEVGKKNGEFIVLSMITIEASSHQCVPNAWTYASSLSELDYYRGFKS